MAYNITFSPEAWADYLYWQTVDKKTLKRINKLLQELQRDGAVRGIGKAELLRHADGMSKRIDDKNRLTYTMEGAGIFQNHPGMLNVLRRLCRQYRGRDEGIPDPDCSKAGEKGIGKLGSPTKH